MKLGEIQLLEVIKKTNHGIYLSDDTNSKEKVLLPRNEVTEDMDIGHKLNVFIYKDSEDRPVATTATPPLTLGNLAMLTVKEVTSIGAFLDWGLAKDLLLPFKEQTKRVENGDQVLIALYIDKSNRLCGTMKVYDYLNKNAPYKKDTMVTGIVYEIIENFGAFVAVDNKYSGLIPNKELFRPISVGEELKARITNVKEDGKLDLSLREKSHIQLDLDAELIYEKLLESDGFLPYHDKSDAMEIKKEFNISKNAFKRSIGRLQKEGKILIKTTGIEKK